MITASTSSPALRLSLRRLPGALLRGTALAGAALSALFAAGTAQAQNVHGNAFFVDTQDLVAYADGLGTIELIFGRAYLIGAETITLGNTLSWNFQSTGTILASPGTTLTLAAPALYFEQGAELHFGLAGDDSGTVVLGGDGGTSIVGSASLVSVDDGILRIGNSTVADGLFDTQAGGEMRIAAGAALEINGYDMTLMNLSGAGTIRNGNGAAATLEIFNDMDTTFSGTIEDGGAGALALTKTGAGTLTLAGAATYAGPTTVAAGALAVNGSLTGTIDILAGATLAGTGSVGSVTVASGATLAPGDALDVLDVAGDLDFASGSTFEVVTDTAAASGLVRVTGTASLGGATVKVVTYDPTVSYALNQTYVIVEAGALDGSFGGVSLDSAFLNSSLSYAGGTVSLNLWNLEIHPLDSVAVTANQTAVARSVNRFDQTAGSGSLAVYNAILFSNEANARDAFDLLSGEIHASLKSGLIEDSRHIRTVVTDRITLAFAATASETGASPWMQGFGAWGRTGSDDNAADMDRSIGGVFIGADGFVTDGVRLGFVTGYSHSRFDVDVSSAGVDSYHLGAYAGAELGGIVLKGGGAIAFNRIDTGRTLDFSGFSDSLSASYDSTLSQIFAEAAHRIDLGAVRLDPYIGLAHVHLATDGFSESGDAAALSGGSDRMDVTYSTLGMRGSMALPAGTMALTATGQIGWRHGFGETGPVPDLAFAGGDAFAVKGLAVPRDTALVDLGLRLAIAPAASLTVSYQGQFGSDLMDNGLSAGFTMKF
ncbi:outer membrane autotransporter protein [Hoeflea marina]|uniref:Outer membrane autotransporter protein n=1 Tax=Hoeflea marina TaxID=274592 RepID=A0A317PIS5_9HYPH|nr:autotransporter domain-containing protein [Hoeflea marina]PWV99107.1 outer membrane autotransporter protein [Hoeflea marina]